MIMFNKVFRGFLIISGEKSEATSRQVRHRVILKKKTILL